jgi:COMPASS component SWD2
VRRYFKGHRRIVNSLEVSPVDDQFISTSLDDTVRLWDLKSPNCHGILNISAPSLAAFDPSGIIFAVASHAAGAIMLYDLRNYDKQPFTTFTVTDDAFLSSFSYPPRMPAWSKLEFSNDGKLMLLGTKGHAHYVIDSFAENTSKFLYRVHRPRGPTTPNKTETSGDVCFTPDGRYIVGGQGDRGVSVWDTVVPPDEKKNLKPVVDLMDNGRSMASCVAFNPRHNLFGSAHKEAVSGVLHRWCEISLLTLMIDILDTRAACTGSPTVAAAIVLGIKGGYPTIPPAMIMYIHCQQHPPHSFMKR